MLHAGAYAYDKKFLSGEVFTASVQNVVCVDECVLHVLDDMYFQDYAKFVFSSLFYCEIS